MSTVMRYREAFKLQVIREGESGCHGSCHAAAMVYGDGKEQLPASLRSAMRR